MSNLSGMGGLATDHPWLGDDDGHNCLTCQERDDAEHLCWPESHLCSLCEMDAPSWPDVMCASCRAETDAVTDEVHDPIEALLNSHARFEPLCTEDSTLCRCGARFDAGAGLHRRHVAELIYDALGIDGPAPWTFGEHSAMRAKFDANGRVIPDVQPLGSDEPGGAS